MSMPDNLILVRHGHSEGNLVTETAKEGDETLYTPDFRERPGHRWRLTSDGRSQATTSGKWIAKNISETFDRYYVSPYIRTRETAALLDLPGAQWRMAQRLRERDWGDIGSLPRSEFKAMYPDNSLMKKLDALYWRPPGGESIADVRLRVRSMFDTMHRECAEQTVIVVTHGEFMWAARAELEYMSDETWLAADKDPAEKIHNTQVIHYSRLDPETGARSHYLNWRRSVCPWKQDHDTGWVKIHRQTYNNDQLLEQVSEVSPIIEV